MNKLAPYLKAGTGALVAGLSSLYQALDNGGVTAQEWVTVAIATLVGLTAVFAVPNKDPNALHQEESVQPPKSMKDTQWGYGDVLYILLVVVVVLVILALVGVLR